METKTIKLETDNNLENVILLPCKPGDSMETKTIKLETLENVIPLIIKPCPQKDSEEWVFVEFPYKHLLPVVEAA